MFFKIYLFFLRNKETEGMSEPGVTRVWDGFRESHGI